MNRRSEPTSRPNKLTHNQFDSWESNLAEPTEAVYLLTLQTCTFCLEACAISVHRGGSHWQRRLKKCGVLGFFCSFNIAVKQWLQHKERLKRCCARMFACQQLSFFSAMAARKRRRSVSWSHRVSQVFFCAFFFAFFFTPLPSMLVRKTKF